MSSFLARLVEIGEQLSEVFEDVVIIGTVEPPYLRARSHTGKIPRHWREQDRRRLLKVSNVEACIRQGHLVSPVYFDSLGLKPLRYQSIVYEQGTDRVIEAVRVNADPGDDIEVESLIHGRNALNAREES